MTRRNRLATISLCFIGFFSAALLAPSTFATTPAQNQTVPNMEQLKAEHQRVLDKLNVKDAKGKPMELDDPRVPELLKQGWSLAGAWGAAFFEAHPKPTAHDLEHLFDGFAPEPNGVKSKYGDFLEYNDYYFEGSAVRIAPSTYVVQASYGVDFHTGTFMVVARDDEGQFRAIWNIKDLAEKHYPLRDEIGRWMHLVRRAYYNGPLDVSRLLPLSPAANGHPRFLVNAYQGADGGTALAQLSIWEWDGMEAEPLLVELYRFALDYGGLHLDGRTIHIATKEDTQAFFSCGMCPEPRGVWTVRVMPTGVQNLGHRYRKPEYRWADELLTKIQRGEDTSKLAAPKAIAALKASMEELKSEESEAAGRSKEKTEFTWGMIDHCRVISRGQEGSFVLATEGAELRFRYVLRHGQPYFTYVRIN